MGRQSARIWYNGKDHKEVYYNGIYHNAIYMNGRVVWQKLASTLDTNYNVNEKTAVAYTLSDHLFLYEKSRNPKIVYRYDLSGGKITEKAISMPPENTAHGENFNCGIYYYRYETRVYYTKDHITYEDIPSTLTFTEPYNPDGTGRNTEKTYQFQTFSENYVWYKETTQYSGTSNTIKCRAFIGDVTVSERFIYPNKLGLQIYGLASTNVVDSILVSDDFQPKLFNGILLPNSLGSIVNDRKAFYYDDHTYYVLSQYNNFQLTKVNELAMYEDYSDKDFKNPSSKFFIYKNYVLSKIANEIHIYNFFTKEDTLIKIPSMSKDLGFYLLNEQLYYAYGRRESGNYYLSLMAINL